MTRKEYGLRGFLLMMLAIMAYLILVLSGLLSYEETHGLFFYIFMGIVIIIFAVQLVLETMGIVQAK